MEESSMDKPDNFLRIVLVMIVATNAANLIVNLLR